MKNYFSVFYISSAGVLLLLCSVVNGAESSAAPLNQDVLTSQAVMQMLLGLALVVVVIFALAWALRRVSNLHQSHQQMKVVSSLSLGTRERAVLIEVGDRQILLGVASGHVSLLESFPNKVISTTPKSEFSKKLQQSLNAGSAK